MNSEIIIGVVGTALSGLGVVIAYLQYKQPQRSGAKQVTASEESSEPVPPSFPPVPRPPLRVLAREVSPPVTQESLQAALDAAILITDTAKYNTAISDIVNKAIKHGFFDFALSACDELVVEQVLDSCLQNIAVAALRRRDYATALEAAERIHSISLSDSLKHQISKAQL